VNSRGSQSNFLAALGLVGQTRATIDSKGNLVLPILGLNGKPRHWVETTPFVWRDTGSHDRLAAKVVDDKVVRFSFDLISPFMVFDRVPWLMNAWWLLPLLYVSLASLLLTALFWPIAAIVRRRYGATLALDTTAMRAFRLSKIAAILILVAMGVWALTFTLILKESSNIDWIIRLAQVIGIIAFIGGGALILWNLRTVWKGTRRWPAKVWSIVLTLSALTVLWIAFAFHLIGFGVNF
jgi:hypothetical protein